MATMKELRTAAGLSSYELADVTGVTAPAVLRWESGISAPRMRLRPLAAKALGVTVDELSKAVTATKAERIRRDLAGEKEIR